jgi:hypothetical protein
MKETPIFGRRIGLCVAVLWMLLSGCDKIEPGAFTAVEKAALSALRRRPWPRCGDRPMV